MYATNDIKVLQHKNKGLIKRSSEASDFLNFVDNTIIEPMLIKSNIILIRIDFN